ncbi:MAG: GGDEF domain-containing protein [Thermodesulfovibrionales bacterium]
MTKTTNEGIKSFFYKIIDILTFTNLPIRKKFILFSAGTLFWIVVTSAIGFIMLFRLSTESKKLVDIIEPQQKVLNSVIRQLAEASMTVHQIFIIENMDAMQNNFHKAKLSIEECHSYLILLRTGGFIREYSQSGNQFNIEFYVSPVTGSEKKASIEDVIAKIVKLENLLSEITYAKESNMINPVTLRGKLSEYDTLTQSILMTLNKSAVSLSQEGGNISDIIKRGFKTALILIILTFFFGASLSIIFGVLISLNLVKPINAIVSNFRSFTSKKDVVKKINVTSKDEIGILAAEYNNFITMIEAMTSFKKIIEEDETVDDVYLRLGTILTNELGLHNFTIYEISTYKNTIKPIYPPDPVESDLYCDMDVLLNCDLCRVKRTGHIISSKEHKDICKFFRREKGDVHICIPIFISGKVGGVVQFVFSKDEASLPELKEKINKTRQYITEAQPVLESKRIMRAFKESSIKDALTGLYNRRFLEETSESLVAGIQRRNTTLGFLMCDLDFFKEVNDKYGHDIGDAVLKETSNIIKKGVRNADLAIRFGGEEFLVLLVDVQPGAALEISNKIRAAMEQTKITITGGVINKTISIGISEFPQDTQSFWEAIKFADVALYKAKETGRNRVVRFSSEMWTEERY